MSNKIEVIRKKLHKTSEWSGGTTTELYIYPKGAIYNERNFKWRLSSAKVEVEKSTFTALKGISRLIMIIKGELMLEHEGHHNARLKAFEQDSFCGDWTTTSFGKVTDFNLMMAQGCTGKLEAISVKSCEDKDILLHNNINEGKGFSLITEAFYIVNGNVDIEKVAKEKISLIKGDLILVTRAEEESTSEFKIHSNSEEESNIIRVTIFYEK
jgi:hypothetical protein